MDIPSKFSFLIFERMKFELINLNLSLPLINEKFFQFENKTPPIFDQSEVSF